MTESDVPPSWLNKDFFEKALQSGEKDESITVISSETNPATIAGDHYASAMYRTKVIFRRGDHTENMSIIIKTIPHNFNEEFIKQMEESDIFDREITMFSKIAPEVDLLLRQAFQDDYQPFTAKHIYSHIRSPTSVIVVEDLKETGFRLASSTVGLDLQHCLLVMKRISQFHAASLVIYKKNPEYFSLFKEHMILRDTKTFEKFLKSNSRGTAKEVETWPAYKERYQEKLHELIDKGIELWTKALERDEAEFNVLSHGDLWANNMMFRYSEESGEVEDVRFIDFQLCYRCSPAVDLHYFLNSSAAPEVVEKIDTLISVYHKNLCETFIRLGYENLKPSLDTIVNDIEKRGIFGLLSCMNIRCVVLADRNRVPDMGKVLTNEENICLSDEFKVVLKKLLPFYEKRGWIIADA